MEDRFNSSLSSPDDFTKPFMLMVVTSTPCCVFFIINGTILYILRSKPSFTQCPRYVLLFNLVLADTVLIAQAQTLYLLVTFNFSISYPVCGCFALLSRLINQISPLTLIFMSLDCSIAVCFPFRHCTLVTLRNTFFAVFLIWTAAICHALILLTFLLEFPFDRIPERQKKELCNIMVLGLGAKFKIYEGLYIYALFIFCGLIILGSIVAVSVVACMAARDKAKTEKMRRTLFVHLFQLGLNLLAVMSVRIYTTAMRCCLVKPSLDAVYVFVLLLPRGISALSYNLRDPVLRPALGSHLCCTLWEGRVKKQVLRKRHKSRANSLKR